MTGLEAETQGGHPPAATDRGHPMPRRPTEDSSITLRNHKQSGAFNNAGGIESPTVAKPIDPPRRNSSGDSHKTTQSDAKKWFDLSNLNSNARYDAVSMDVDTPFFQKETDSSNEEHLRPSSNYPFLPSSRQRLLRPSAAPSSGADDYRSVIDDLTVENKRLKEELKRYRQFSQDAMKKEKLFEIKVHGLPQRKKRELEATLRDFAASLGGSSEATSQRRNSGRHGKSAYYSGESMSKHASSSSSNSRPIADSAYASMSTGPSSNAPTSHGRPSSIVRAKSSGGHKVVNRIADTPDGLLPHNTMMTDKERKNIVVRRLEQLFTGQISGGKKVQRAQSMSDMEPPAITRPGDPDPEAAREAQIEPSELVQKKGRSRDTLSASNSNGDQTESGGNGSGSGGRSGDRSGHGGNNTPPMGAPPPDQRPTRPRDVDPDRVQIPSENMEYIRHLGLVPPQFIVSKTTNHQDVSPDADGWVYLNLLGNLAQLHMLNVTPSFIRSAVDQRSAKFQLSSDGRKIRWRGGSNGTNFRANSSQDNSRDSQSNDNTDDSQKSGGQKKRPKLTRASSGTGSSLDRQVSGSAEGFHYKPIFPHSSSLAETSLEGTGSQDSAVEDSTMDKAGNSRWEYSGSGSSPRKKRRRDGAIIYYSGAPFCTDLSGDVGDISPATYMTSSRPQVDSFPDEARPEVGRSLSGSSLPIRPLSIDKFRVSPVSKIADPGDIMLDNAAESGDDELSSDGGFELPWCDHPERLVPRPVEPPLEPCGLGGVVPEDHFAVLVTTRRSILRGGRAGGLPRASPTASKAPADSIVGPFSTRNTSSPVPPRERLVSVEYLSGRLRRLKPLPLPPPATFFPPVSTDASSDSDGSSLCSDMEGGSGPGSVSQSMISKQANPHLSDNPYSDDESLSSNDEEDEVDEDNDTEEQMHPSSDESWAKGPQKPEVPGHIVSGSEGGRSSEATAGGAASGYGSSMEEDDS